MKTKLKNLLKELSERSTINNQYEVLTSSQNGIVGQTEYFNKQVASVQNTGYKIIRKGQFTYRSMSDTGLFFINRLTAPEIGIVSPAYPVFEIISVDVLPEYLELFFRSTNFQHQISTESTGSTRLALRYNKLCDLEINVPSLCIQSEIVHNINAITNAIDLEIKHLKLYDELIKSRFIEMFDGKGYPSKLGKELFKFSSGKFLVQEKRMDSGIPVYGGNGIAWYTNESLIDFDTIIIGRVGAYCGNARLARGSKWITDNALYISQFKTDDFSLEFLEELMIMYDFHQYAGVAAQPKITQKPLEEQMYLVPPKEEQIKFAKFCKQLDKSKFIVQKRIELYKELLAKKMDEYFN